MRKWITFFFLKITLLTTSLFGWAGYPSPGSIGVVGDFLYFLPSVDDTYFVFTRFFTADLEGVVEKNDFGFQPGFRVGVIYSFCDCDREIELYYTRLHATIHRQVVGSDLYATVGPASFLSSFSDYFGSASSNNQLLYQRVDGFLGQQLYCFCGLELAVKGGIEYANISSQSDLLYDDTIDLGLYHKRSHLWGVGPQVGVMAGYTLWNVGLGTLSATFASSGSILSGKTEREFLTRINEEMQMHLIGEDTWRLIPAFHSSVGLNYAACFCSLRASLELGYEFNTYIRAISQILVEDGVNILDSFTNYYNFDLQGLYLKASLAF